MNKPTVFFFSIKGTAGRAARCAWGDPSEGTQQGSVRRRDGISPIQSYDLVMGFFHHQWVGVWILGGMFWKFDEFTLSPIIMVQWRTTLNERKLILGIHPFSTEPWLWEEGQADGECYQVVFFLSKVWWICFQMLLLQQSLVECYPENDVSKVILSESPDFFSGRLSMSKWSSERFWRWQHWESWSFIMSGGFWNNAC